MFFYQVLGFSEYIEEVYAAYEQHKLETMVIFNINAACEVLIQLSTITLLPPPQKRTIFTRLSNHL